MAPDLQPSRRRRYSFEPLERVIGGSTIAYWAKALSIDPSQLALARRKGLTPAMAVRFAELLGLDPGQIWTDWSAPTQAGRPWTERENSVLTQMYQTFPTPQKLPIKEVAAILGRSSSALRAQAVDLGLTCGPRPCGPPRTVPDQLCPRCGELFTPGQQGRIFCSKPCADTGKWEEREHPRGMAGKVHSTATKQRLRETTGEMISDLAERKRRVDLMREGRERQLASGPPSERVHTRAKGGRRPDIDNRYFRSSWEANYARWLNYLVVAGNVSGWEYEPRTFEFPVKKGNKYYTPDFLVTFPDGRSEWHEVKGWMDANSRVKLSRFARHYPKESLVLIDGPAYRAIAGTAAALVVGWE